jgi:hypothetical protein
MIRALLQNFGERHNDIVVTPIPFIDSRGKCQKIIPKSRHRFRRWKLAALENEGEEVKQRRGDLDDCGRAVHDIVQTKLEDVKRTPVLFLRARRQCEKQPVRPDRTCERFK